MHIRSLTKTNSDIVSSKIVVGCVGFSIIRV